MAPPPSESRRGSIGTTSGEPGRHKFIAIGIDFGTTYSGVSWAFSERPDTIYDVKNWPSQFPNNHNEDQAPTQFEPSTNKWGYEVEKEGDPLRWFKLLLLKPEDVPAEIRNSELLIQNRARLERTRNLTAVQVVGKYLKELWKHACQQISQVIDLESLPIRAAITVPAIWPYYAQQAMREAATLAGILDYRPIGDSTLELTSEPEAAGQATLFERGSSHFPSFTVGSIFVVCDAGGGTVDIITYRVISIDPFRLKECVPGQGKLSGAFLVDQAFDVHLRNVHGLKISRLSQKDHNEFVTRVWEYGVKRSFHGDPAQPPQTFNLFPPRGAFGTMRRWGGRDSFSLSKANMDMFFSRSLDGIRSLIHSQIAQVTKDTGSSVTGILLVGGLGSSTYIYNRLQEEYKGRVKRPGRPWSAVAQGAVMNILGEELGKLVIEDPDLITPDQRRMIMTIPSVHSRRSRLHYGITVQKSVDRLRDISSEDETEEDPDGVTVVSRMDWFLKIGDEIVGREPIRHKYQQFSNDSRTVKVHVTIQTSDSPQPPLRPGPDVRRMCSIECNADIPFQEWTAAKRAKGFRKYDKLSLEMTFAGEPKWKIRAGENSAERSVNVKL